MLWLGLPWAHSDEQARVTAGATFALHADGEPLRLTEKGLSIPEVFTRPGWEAQAGSDQMSLLTQLGLAGAWPYGWSPFPQLTRQGRLGSAPRAGI